MGQAVEDWKEYLKENENYSRAEILEALRNAAVITDTQLEYSLRKKVRNGELVRTGWGHYALPGKSVYSPSYSSEVLSVVNVLLGEFSCLDYRIFELRELNVFLNHLVSHNTVFVSVEGTMMNFVFDALWSKYPGKVMLKPNADEYYRYRQDGMIVVLRLPSETPKGNARIWESRLEKILVDVLCDRLISSVVPEEEKRNIVENAFRDYPVDMNTLYHYARRKGAAEKVRELLMEYQPTHGASPGISQ